jgi:putative transposase
MRKHYSASFKAEIIQEVLKEDKLITQIASAHGVHPNQIGEWKAIALKGLPSLFEKEHSELEKLRAAHERQVKEMYEEIGRLTTKVAWLKKKLALAMSRGERLALVEREPDELPLGVQADLLGLGRSSLYYQPTRPSLEEIALKHRIDEIYTAHPFYGSRRITVELGRQGLAVNRKAVQRHMQEMGIAGICPGPNLSKRNSQHQVYPYLLRSIRAAYPNHIWGVDITYVRLRAGWMYLVAILDWFSRYVVAWELDQTLEIGFVLAAVDRALGMVAPVIWNSDQGSHFTSPQYTERLLARDVQISMDGKGRALDNVFTERLWRTVKYENVYLADYTTPKATREGLTSYLEFYNQERPHQSLAYRTPAEVYFDPQLARTGSEC